MKQSEVPYSADKVTVAPFAGAWIETAISEADPLDLLVAPFAGAWIETFSNCLYSLSNGVAPFAGAWIETDVYAYYNNTDNGRSFRRSVD